MTFATRLNFKGGWIDAAFEDGERGEAEAR